MAKMPPNNAGSKNAKNNPMPRGNPGQQGGGAGPVPPRNAGMEGKRGAQQTRPVRKGKM